MKLSKLYANKGTFKSIHFDKGINFILATDHSVGKTTLFTLIDFCLLKGDKGFLAKPQFEDYIFYLELEIETNKYITIKRPVSGTANIEVKISDSKNEFLDATEFDKRGGVTAIKTFLESNFHFCIAHYRQYITYFLRDQDNQSDIFRLNKFLRQNDIVYKPIIANLLGIDGDKIKKKYELEDEISKLEEFISVKQNELGSYRTKESLEEEISVYTKQLVEKESLYNNFDFYLAEKNISKELVKEIETEISTLNQERNSLNREIEYIDQSLREEIAISIQDVDGLFEEMKVLFPKDLKENYSNVLAFNKQIAEERTKVFKENKKEFLSQVKNIERELEVLNEKRVNILSVLKNTDTMQKFKDLEKEVISLTSKIAVHHNKLEIFTEIEAKKDELKTKRDHLNLVIRENKKLTTNPFIGELKKNLIKYGKLVFNKEIAFSIGFNTSDNIDFDLKVEDTNGFDNSLEDGHTIKKLLCFIFSAAIVETYKEKNFIKFLAFDSPFDGDKNTYQQGVYAAIKELQKYDIEVIITSICDAIKAPEMLKEIEEKYTIRTLGTDDKLLGNF